MRKLPAICLVAALGCAHRPPAAAPAPIRGRAVIPATWTLHARPVAAPHDMFVDSAGNPTDKSEIGHLAAGVPGSVAGLYEAWQKYGTLPWATLIAPAIRLAQGHVIDSARNREIASDRSLLARFPASRA